VEREEQPAPRPVVRFRCHRRLPPPCRGDLHPRVHGGGDDWCIARGIYLILLYWKVRRLRYRGIRRPSAIEMRRLAGFAWRFAGQCGWRHPIGRCCRCTRYAMAWQFASAGNWRVSQVNGATITLTCDEKISRKDTSRSGTTPTRRRREDNTTPLERSSRSTPPAPQNPPPPREKNSAALDIKIATAPSSVGTLQSPCCLALVGRPRYAAIIRQGAEPPTKQCRDRSGDQQIRIFALCWSVKTTDTAISKAAGRAACGVPIGRLTTTCSCAWW